MVFEKLTKYAISNDYKEQPKFDSMDSNIVDYRLNSDIILKYLKIMNEDMKANSFKITGDQIRSKLHLGSNGDSGGNKLKAENLSQLMQVYYDLVKLDKLSDDKYISEAKVLVKSLANAGIELANGKTISDINTADSIENLKKLIKDVNNLNNNNDLKTKYIDRFDTTTLFALDAAVNLSIIYDNLQSDAFVKEQPSVILKIKEAIYGLKAGLIKQGDKTLKQQVYKYNKKGINDKKIHIKDTPEEILAQYDNLQKASHLLLELKMGNFNPKIALESRQKTDSEMTQIAKFKEAIWLLKKSGIVVENNSELKKMLDFTATNIDDKVLSDSGSGAIKDAIDVLVNGVSGVELVKKALNAQIALASIQARYDLKAKTFLQDPRVYLSSMGKDVILSMTDVATLNDNIANYLTQDTANILSFLKANEDSIQSATNEIGKVSNLDMVNFSSQLSTQTRLAKLSNPFNEDLALASAINKLSNDKFADNGGDSVSSVIKSYTDRFNNDNNIWANVIGAKGKVKDSSNPELHGFSIGYDRAFDNTIVGGYMTLAKSKADSSLINTKASNYQFGLYARTYIDNSEIDTRVSFGKAKNKIQRNAILENRVLTQDGKYDTTYTSFAVDYGYVMNLSDSLFMKPLVGLDYSHSKSKAFKESGDLPLSFNGVTSKSLNAKLGLEFRKYVDNGNYLYITPGFEAEVYKDVKDPVARFIGSSKDIKLKADDKKGRFVTLKTGAELKLTDALSTNVNFGVKAKSKQQYFDGTIGLKYKF
ncbi:autotransporter outer membrane beta-barrel domain-containing protein [Campylobacter pinnipediorum]|uniref:autotransporter outer membrane beta-barrel domain-containing protein n=1 Tax=Campylobacter pinnipediorum TaxID=1965231 RepID=UPI0009953F96|nr:autotransporter outer membrane beta-barrel domain-containing protein [Campylobacter pinnipediorum]AQW83701.1 autotransporter domain protein [Campylobacter pinnipediorum subsp. pinnipediorum]